MVEVVCPNCGTTRTIVLKDGTKENKRVRCSAKSGGCGKLFYSKKNIVIVVPQTRTKLFTNKTSDKRALIVKICNILKKYKDELPLDILRGKLLELEALGEMRKK